MDDDEYLHAAAYDRARARGYRFITLDQALADEAYRTPDGYGGRRGLSWLQRWAITRNEEPGERPAAPEWVRQPVSP